MLRNGAVERLGPGDVVELATDVGPVPMNVGAVLYLTGHVDVATLEDALAHRVAAIPRLRQALADPPFGLGRPYWTEDPHLDVGAHLSRERCPGDGDHDAVLTAAVDAVTMPLPRSRPLWRAVLLTGLDNGGAAVVVVLHHVLADGIGGLAVLERLVDGAEAVPPRPSSAEGRAPRVTDQVRDQVRERATALLRALSSVPAVVARVSRGRTEIGWGRGAPRCSLNTPTGPRRQVRTVEVELDPVRAAAHRHGATVNDALLVVVTGAMARLLGRRGEDVADLVVSVPVSARVSTTSDELGNRVGVMPVRVPVHGSVAERLTAVARLTRDRKTPSRGASGALVGPAFRLLAAFGLFRWFVDRQRLVNSFLSNLRGPSRRLSVAGIPVGAIVPITITAGNVGVAFAALSYAGTLTLTVIVDPDVVPEIATLAAGVQQQVQALLESPGARVSG